MSQDHGGLLLLATAAGNGDMVAKLGLQAEQAGKHNVSFLSYFMLGQLEKCLQILLDSNRIPEAAFFARTYLPSEISRIVELWREQLSKVNEKAGQSLADPKVSSKINNILISMCRSTHQHFGDIIICRTTPTSSPTSTAACRLSRCWRGRGTRSSPPRTSSISW